MKGALFFNLPDEEEEFEHATRGENYMSAINQIAQEVFRRRLKYTDMSQEQTILVTDMQREFYEILSDRNIIKIKGTK